MKCVLHTADLVQVKQPYDSLNKTRKTHSVWRTWFCEIKMNKYVNTYSNNIGSSDREISFFSVVQLQLSYLFPHCSPLYCSAPQPPFSHSPMVCAQESSTHVPWIVLSLSFPCYALPPPLWSLSFCSLFPCLLLYFAYIFVLLIRFHSYKITWHLSFTICLVSLNIMLSRSIHADVKGRSSLFLSAV